VTSLQTDHIARVLETGDPASGLPYVPGLRQAIDQIVMTAFAKDPQQRFATAAAFAEAFSLAVAAH
jgi:hypothetical protein